MTLVLDASVAIDLLLRSRRGEEVRQRLGAEGSGDLVTVTHLDAEVFSALARHHRAGLLAPTEVGVLLDRLADLGAVRLPITAALLRSAWARATPSPPETACTSLPPERSTVSS